MQRKKRMYFLLNFGWYSIQFDTEVRTGGGGGGGGGGVLNKQNLLSVMQLFVYGPLQLQEDRKTAILATMFLLEYKQAIEPNVPLMI